MDLEAARCAGCLLPTLAPGERDRLAPLYHQARMAAHAAGIPAWATTFPVAWGGAPRLARMRGYVLSAFGALIRGWSADGDYYPSLIMDGLVDPDDVDRQSISLVWFAMEIRHDDVASGCLRYVFPFRDLALPPKMEIVGGLDPGVSEQDLVTLVKGRRMYEVFKQSGGRPPGSKRDRHYYLNGYRECSRAFRRPVTQDQLIECLRDQGDAKLNRTSLVRNLKTFRLWPWNKFVAEAGRTDNRR